MRAALVADQQRIALRIVPRALGSLQDLHHAPIAVLAAPGGNPLGYNGALRILSDVDHFGTGVSLLEVIDHGH